MDYIADVPPLDDDDISDDVISNSDNDVHQLDSDEDMFQVDD